MDDELKALGHAARADVEGRIDVEADLDTAKRIGPRELAWQPVPVEPHRPVGTWFAAAAAALIAVAAGWFITQRDGDGAIETAEPTVAAPTTERERSTMVASTPPSTSAASATLAPTQTVAPSTTESPAAVVPATTLGPDHTSAPITEPAIDEPMVATGSIALGPDDLIARTVDGDVVWYPGALGNERGESVVLVDRADPRVRPAEGEPPNIIDQVAGTYDGTLIYSDCCEPVSGNVFAITEPGAEVDLWGAESGGSERARYLAVGSSPQLEPGGSRLLASSQQHVGISDLASGALQFASHSELVDGFSDGFFDGFVADAVWTTDGDIALILWSSAEGLTVSGRSASDIDAETDRVSIEADVDLASFDAQFPTVVGVAGDRLTIALYEPAGIRIIDVDLVTWEVTPTGRPFEVPGDASFARLSPDGTVMATIVDDTVHLQREGEQRAAWRDGIAEVWFPSIS